MNENLFLNMYLSDLGDVSKQVIDEMMQQINNTLFDKGHEK